MARILSVVKMTRKISLETYWYILPALFFLLVFLLYPTVHTFYLSFFDPDSSSFVGLKNYVYLFTHKEISLVLRNNLLWLTLFTVTAVGMGLFLAVLSDRLRYEPVIKAIIFIPMAISFTAAAVIWRFMYLYRPEGFPQTGLVNALWVSLGGTPVAWLVNLDVNNFALIAAAVWMWTGFGMIVISAGLKGIPSEVLEAARVEGAGEWQLFWHIIQPMLRPILIVVALSLTINALKIFDLVYVMTFGNHETDVIANRMFKEMFIFANFGRASAIAVILLLFVIPLMVMNIRRFRQGESK
jgi:alpha-glucoside transport system permease protein